VAEELFMYIYMSVGFKMHCSWEGGQLFIVIRMLSVHFIVKIDKQLKKYTIINFSLW